MLTRFVRIPRMSESTAVADILTESWLPVFARKSMPGPVLLSALRAGPSNGPGFGLHLPETLLNNVFAHTCTPFMHDQATQIR